MDRLKQQVFDFVDRCKDAGLSKHDVLESLVNIYMKLAVEAALTEPKMDSRQCAQFAFDVAEDVIKRDREESRTSR